MRKVQNESYLRNRIICFLNNFMGKQNLPTDIIDDADSKHIKSIKMYHD